MNARTTEILNESADHFVADLDNGGVRVGMVGSVCIDFPAGHKYFDEAKSLAGAADFDAAAEAFIVSQVECGNIDPRAF